MDAALEGLVEKMGLRLAADGLPRTAGRILGYLLLSSEARSLDELAEALRVSKASVSSNARLLEAIGVIVRTSHPGDRRDYYRAAEDLHVRLLKHWARGLRETEALLEEALGDGGVVDDAAVRGRLETFTAFFGHMLEEIQGAGQRWSDDPGDLALRS